MKINTLNKTELITLAKEKGLAYSGTKAMIIERLTDSNSEKKPLSRAAIQKAETKKVVPQPLVNLNGISVDTANKMISNHNCELLINPDSTKVEKKFLEGFRLQEKIGNALFKDKFLEMKTANGTSITFKLTPEIISKVEKNEWRIGYYEHLSFLTDLLKSAAKAYAWEDVIGFDSETKKANLKGTVGTAVAKNAGLSNDDITKLRQVFKYQTFESQDLAICKAIALMPKK